MAGDRRDHLFINYAYEDADVARWLMLKLTAAGYRVWCDQICLLGGESYPRDIDRAIRDHTFRMISLLSRASVNKPNPLKERTLAVNISTARGIDFIIPVRVDDLAPSELNFHIADLTFIDFSSSWADGYRRLTKRLESIKTPRPLSNGRELVAEWYDTGTPLARRPERLWSNLVEFTELPAIVYRVSSMGPAGLAWPDDWPRVDRGLATWAFEVPAFPAGSVALLPVDWRGEPPEPDLRLRDLVTNLLRQYVRTHARRRGLFLLEDGSLYFPKGFLAKDRLSYRGVTGTGRWVQVAGERVFRLGNDRRQTVRYHLAFRARPNLRAAAGTPVLRIALSLYLTEPGGKPLDAKAAHRRRRRMCKRWYNDEWLKRVLAVVSFLADGEGSINLAVGPSTRLVLAGRPLQLVAPVGIDEQLLGRSNVEALDVDVADDEDEGVGIA